MAWIIGFLIWLVVVGFVWAIVAAGSSRQVECEHGVLLEYCPECGGESCG